jgi:hypothetical protein
LDEALEKEVYQQPALMPLSPWLGHTQPSKPKLRLTTSPKGVSWSASGSGKPWLWLLQTKAGGEWTTEILPAATTSRAWKGTAPETVALCTINRNAELSTPVLLQVQR